MSGKWHLGFKDSLTRPSARGFEETFVLLGGGASHWEENKPLIPGKPSPYALNGAILDSLPDDFYSTKNYTNAIIGNIEKNKSDGKPFFAYLSYTAPHNPLHAPKEYIDKYKGKYDLGWDALAAKRLEHLKYLKLIEKKRAPFPRPDWIKAWDELPEEQKKLRARDMEIYAAMIDYLDESIGQLFSYLKRINEYENTVIIFLSDNGASRTTIEDYAALGGETSDYFSSFDNSIDNRGLPNSMTDIGPGWAWAISTPFRMTKGYVSQGGIQTPLIIKFPGTMKYAARKKSVIVHVMDIMPTILDYLEINPPEIYNGNQVLPVQGMSLVKVIGGGSDRKFENRGIGMELYGMRAFRRGDWKILNLVPPYGTGEWQLYNLDEDSAEMDDISEKYSKIYNELIEAWNTYAIENGFIEPDRPVAYAKPPKKDSY
jgi:arylsulfatase A-like enzyme